MLDTPSISETIFCSLGFAILGDILRKSEVVNKKIVHYSMPTLVSILLVKIANEANFQALVLEFLRNISTTTINCFQKSLKFLIRI